VKDLPSNDDAASSAVRVDRLAVSVNNAAFALSIGRTTLYGLLKSGRLTGLKLGRRTLILKSSLDRLLAGDPYSGTTERAAPATARRPAD
jgi:excisionase family DNA binding protein